MLLYSSLYLSGYGLSLEDIKRIRQCKQQNPGASGIRAYRGG
ncbi:MAG: hypothetical protein R2860_11615 [Desulfobacterales bacterium]